MDVILLPGLDGTGTLFSPFLDRYPDWAEPRVMSYDRDTPQRYDELADLVCEHVDGTRPYILLGESFSGPVAVSVAARAPGNLAGVLLCASFVSNPRPGLARLFHPSLLLPLFRMGAPAWVIRQLLTGREGSPELAKLVASAAESVSPEVLIARLGMVIEVDVGGLLAASRVPLMYVRATRDRLVSEVSLREVQSLRPDVSVWRVEGPHCIAQTKPVEVWQGIERFARGIGAI